MVEKRAKVDKLRLLYSLLEKHPDLKEQLIGTRPGKPQRTPRTLYLQASILGIHWNKEHRYWYVGSIQRRPRTAPKAAKPPVNGAEPRITVSTAAKDRIMLRVIAHESIIQAVTADLAELIEALNFTVLSVSDPQESEEGSYKRVYIRLQKSYR